jgi:hypothetical protein
LLFALLRVVRGGPLEVVLTRCAGLDVHQANVVATARVPGEAGSRRAITETFGTMTPDLLALREWLQALGVTHVPGRKTDVQDSAWLAQWLECGLLRSSFVPPPPAEWEDAERQPLSADPAGPVCAGGDAETGLRAAGAVPSREAPPRTQDGGHRRRPPDARNCLLRHA